MAFVSAQGTTFTFDGDSYKCMDISYETTAPSRERVDMSSLEQADGDEMRMMVAPLLSKRDPAKFSITFRSEGTVPAAGTVAALATADGSGDYLCTKVGISRKTNTYVEGTAEFEEIIEDEVPA